MWRDELTKTSAWGKHRNILRTFGWVAEPDMTGTIVEWASMGTLSHILADPTLKAVSVDGCPFIVQQALPNTCMFIHRALITYMMPSLHHHLVMVGPAPQARHRRCAGHGVPPLKRVCAWRPAAR